MSQSSEKGESAALGTDADEVPSRAVHGTYQGSIDDEDDLKLTIQVAIETAASLNEIADVFGVSIARDNEREHPAIMSRALPDGKGLDVARQITIRSLDDRSVTYPRPTSSYAERSARRPVNYMAVCDGFGNENGRSTLML